MDFIKQNKQKLEQIVDAIILYGCHGIVLHGTQDAA